MWLHIVLLLGVLRFYPDLTAAKYKKDEKSSGTSLQGLTLTLFAKCCCAIRCYHISHAVPLSLCSLLALLNRSVPLSTKGSRRWLGGKDDTEGTEKRWRGKRKVCWKEEENKAGDHGWWGGQRYRDQSTGSKSLASTRGARGRQRSMRSRAHGLVHHRRRYITVKTHTSWMSGGGRGKNTDCNKKKTKQVNTDKGQASLRTQDLVTVRRHC